MFIIYYYRQIQTKTVDTSDERLEKVCYVKIVEKKLPKEEKADISKKEKDKKEPKQSKGYSRQTEIEERIGALEIRESEDEEDDDEEEEPLIETGK